MKRCWKIWPVKSAIVLLYLLYVAGNCLHYMQFESKLNILTVSEIEPGGDKLPLCCMVSYISVRVLFTSQKQFSGKESRLDNSKYFSRKTLGALHNLTKKHTKLADRRETKSILPFCWVHTSKLPLYKFSICNLYGSIYGEYYMDIWNDL